MRRAKPIGLTVLADTRELFRPSFLALLPLLMGMASPDGAISGDLAQADFPDPFVLREGDAYVAFATGGHGAHVQVAQSGDLSRWTRLPDALPTLPAWAAQDAALTWAPAVLKRGSAYVLYYTAADTVSGFQCISRATARRPQGPYVDDSARPFVCQIALCGSIDPSPYVDADARPYLAWKSDENAAPCRGSARLWAQPLSDDGLVVTGAATALLTMDSAWERPLVEGPSMTRHDGRYYLFYSAGWYDSAGYAIGYATCAQPLGPCTKVTRGGPLVASAGPLAGPGGQELFADASGATWMAYHGWTAPHSSYAAGGARSLHIAPVTFAGGVPSLGGMAPLRSP